MELTSSKQNIFDVSPWRAITGLCIPSLISIVVMMLYNMADMYFVAWMNDLRQVAAVSLASPVFSILMAISTMIGNGGCTKIAQALGQGDEEKVRKYSALCFWASVGFGLLFALFCFGLQRPARR
jgi:multidrug efflux pump